MDSPRIRYLDGDRLRRAVIAGARHLIARRRHLDHINVFPVPDADTGTNMAAAAQYLIDSLKSVRLVSVRHTADAVAEAILMGGRGNSGAILAQFFQGFAEGLGQQSRVRVNAFATAVVRAAHSAREAVSDPREGTILTVMSDWADAIRSAARSRADYVEALRHGHAEAERSLSHTPDLLPVLKEAHVVDAGAQGFLYLLDGVRNLIETGVAERDEPVVVVEEEEIHTEDLPDETTYRWCTECLIDGIDLDREAIRTMLEAKGDSVVIAGSRKTMRVHVHTDEPGSVVDALREWGKVSREKADDMEQQRRHVHHPPGQRVAIVADTATDLPAEILATENIHPIPFRIFFGDQQYIDKVTLTNASFYDKLKAIADHPKTTQPTQADFLRAYEIVSKHYEAVVSIHVPAALSGTFQSARKAASTVSDRIRVIDSNSGSIGLGLIALEAARAAQDGLDADGVEARVRAAIDRTTILISLETTEYLLKGGRIGRTRAAIGRLLNVKIVLGVDSRGDIIVRSRLVGGRDPGPELLRLLSKQARGRKVARAGVSHASNPEKASWYADQLKRTYGDVDVLMAEFSPALGVHAGPGAVGVAIMWE